MQPARGRAVIRRTGTRLRQLVREQAALRRVATLVASGADPARGSGLTGLKDRIEALGGKFFVDSPVGHGTAVTCELPLVSDGGYADAHRDEAGG